ncbi:NAD(P)/FAD-dependent oxidoreductase [Alcaligenaceae bacterium]|nr:NAD(P)/FAD-dependent oxidoreductase [Alcaligenaceae bacterium]
MLFDFKNITADEGFLREAIEQADIATLSMVLVQLSGDTEILQTIKPYVHGPWNYSVDMPEDLQSDLRERLIALLKDYAETGRALPPPPPVDQIQSMMSACVGEEVPADFVPMMMEELAFHGGDTREISWQSNDARDAASEFKVLIIGAGMSGVLAAIKLKRMGIPFVVIEKNDAVGGTWYENRYPGCGVDTPNHLYSYSFEPDHIWTQFFSKQKELQAYFERTVDRHGLRDNIRFNTEVVSAIYQDVDGSWEVVSRDRSTGEEVKYNVRAVISAVGQLNRPQMPDIKGLSSFKGKVLHTGAWDDKYPLAGKRVAMIGTGASAIQAAPTIAPQVSELHIFQRTPHWIIANRNYHASVTSGKKWVLEHLPFYARWYRFQLFWAFSDAIHNALVVDPNWPHQERSLNARNERFRINLTQYYKDKLGENSELLKKVIPDYPPYGKRMLIDNHWFDMLQRDNVELITEGIDRIEADAIFTKDGARHEVDVIIMATGFAAHKMLWPMDIRGNDGVALRDLWGDDDPRAYLGITVPKFPNFFLLYGPNTHLGHGGSIIFHSECQMRYIAKCLRWLIETGHKEMEVLEAVHDDYNDRCDDAHSKMVWTTGATSNWYRNTKGRVVSNSPWRLVDYWAMTFEPDFNEYKVR